VVGGNRGNRRLIAGVQDLRIWVPVSIGCRQWRSGGRRWWPPLVGGGVTATARFRVPGLLCFCVFFFSLSLSLADSGKEIKGKENAKAAARIVGSDTNLM